ncbi:hypothetical protein ABD76_18290 [Paenibacillus dendritiformis]|nr:hypothetical protein [Paenibacillus dendritiformis]
MCQPCRKRVLETLQFGFIGKENGYGLLELLRQIVFQKEYRKIRNVQLELLILIFIVDLFYMQDLEVMQRLNHLIMR